MILKSIIKTKRSTHLALNAILMLKKNRKHKTIMTNTEPLSINEVGFARIPIIDIF